LLAGLLLSSQYASVFDFLLFLHSSGIGGCSGSCTTAAFLSFASIVDTQPLMHTVIPPFAARIGGGRMSPLCGGPPPVIVVCFTAILFTFSELCGVDSVD